MISISNENIPQIKPDLNHTLTFSELSECIQNNNSEPLISYLNQSKNSPNITNSSKETLLHVSVKNAKKNFSELLLSYGTNPNIQNNNLQTPLHLIVINKNIDMLKIFKEYNSDFNNIKDIYNKTVYDYVIENGNEYKTIFDEIFLNRKSNNSEDNSSVKIISPKNQIFTESDFKKLSSLNDINVNNNVVNTFDNLENNKNNIIEQDYASNKEIIKNIITQTIKKVNIDNSISNNTSNNNLSENYNTNSPTENINNNKSNNSIYNNNNNLNNNINNSDILNSLSKKSLNNNNNKTINNYNNSNSNKSNINISNINPINDTSEMNPLDLINQVITTNSNIFSELNSRQNTQNNVNNNNNAINNFNLKTEEDDKNILTDMDYSKSKSNIISSSKKSNSNKSDNKENIEKNNLFNSNNNFISKNINSINIDENNIIDNNNNNNENNKIEIEIYNSNNNNLKLNDNSSNYNSNNNNNMIIYNNLVYNNSTIETRPTTHGRNTDKNFIKKFPQINTNNINNINNNNINNNTANFSTFNTNTLNNNIHNNSKNNLNNNLHKKKSSILTEYAHKINNQNINPYLNNTFNVIEKNKSIQSKKNNFNHNQNNNITNTNIYQNELNYFNNENKENNNNSNSNNYINININNDNEENNNNNNNDNNTNKNEDIFFIDSPSKEQLLKFHDWLASCELLSYYNILLSNNIYEIDKIILGIKKKEINVSFNDVEDIGIKKPGHILRFLLKIEMEIGNIDSKISEFIFNVFDNNNHNNSFIQLSNSNLNYCCYYKNNNEFNNEDDVEKFLRKNGLINFKDNFIHNGFDSIAFIFLQIFSKYVFNDEFLIEYLHIYNENNRKKILKILYLEKNKICKYLKISPSKYENNFYETSTNENSNICCMLF